MKEVKKEAISPEVFRIYDDYVHNRIDRRLFLDKLSKYAIGGFTLPSLLKFLMPNYTDKIQVKAGDPRLKSEYIYYESPNGGGKIRALLSWPADSTAPLPGIIVVH
ncbi:MAG TPA: dienelactone hydrolase family protein, partial [Saprospiraceae bacterium]|nr:dienelactone hydrolase family protein [Saprospiraceae bacterium]